MREEVIVNEEFIKPFFRRESTVYSSAGLACLFHTLSAAARHLRAPTALRSIRVLDVLPEYASGLEPSRA